LEITWALLWDILLNLNVYLTYLIINYGLIAYLVIFLIIFCETGLVIFPFLPGDSMIFIIGALGASGEINLYIIAILMMTAAVLGNEVNFRIGSFIGPKVFEKNIRFLKKEYLFRTRDFFARHGNKTIFIARFFPIIRTFAPFVAGVGQMDKRTFTLFNGAGSICWVLVFLLGGYVFGNIPQVEKNFTLFIFGIIFLSFIPAIFAAIKARKKK
jgi:membrane-associated protein